MTSAPGTPETTAVVVVTWPNKATEVRPQRFPDAAATLARMFAEAAWNWPGSRPKDGGYEPP
jgi:phytoene dehydrogenase-like protein